MIWHSTAAKPPTHWVRSDLLTDGRIRITIFDATDDGAFILLTVGDALDLADQITKQASL